MPENIGVSTMEESHIAPLITVELDPKRSEKGVNPKQIELYNRVMLCFNNCLRLYELTKEVQTATKPTDIVRLKKELTAIRKTVRADDRRFHYGGGIRGGKTVIDVFLIYMAARIFPESRWLIVRKAFPDLQRSVIQTFEGMIGQNHSGTWRQSRDYYYYELSNKSRIIFMAENYTQDKNFTRFLGLEINGVLFEQIEEITEKGYNMICSRLASWKRFKGAEPPALVLTNFNPTYGWVKTKIDDPGMKGELPEREYFIEALAADNPHNTDEQHENWQKLDPETYARMILGKRDVEVIGAFLYGFDKNRNVGFDLKIDINYSIYLSFDFNVDPMTCLVMQTDYENFIHVIREIRIPNSDTYEMCATIKPLIEGLEHLVIVTGDASGKNRQSAAYGHANQYQIIMQELELSSNQFRILEVNPSISDSRTFCNSVITKFPSVLVNHECEWLIKDLMFVTASTDINGDICIQKGGQNIHLTIDNKHLGHLMDCFRYCLHIMLPKWFITTKKAITS